MITNSSIPTVLSTTRLIAVEGSDGTGKTTLVAALKEYMDSKLAFYAAQLNADSLKCITFGAWTAHQWTQELRTALVAGDLSEYTEMMIAFLARRELLLTKVLPEVRLGNFVILDRYAASTFAYQCRTVDMFRKGLDMYRDSCELTLPGLTFYLHAEPEVLLGRLAERGESDGIEARGVEFMKDTDVGYRIAFNSFAMITDGLVVPLDANVSADAVKRMAFAVVDDYLSTYFTGDPEARMRLLEVGTVRDSSND